MQAIPSWVHGADRHERGRVGDGCHRPGDRDFAVFDRLQGFIAKKGMTGYYYQNEN
jgi:hypothetical protein